VSVITIVRNGFPQIERAIESVLGQAYPAIEYIIKDGASTDGTLGVLERYRHRVDRIESTKDSGPPAAWNEGLALSSGRYVALLNSDDEFGPGLVEKAVAALEESGADLAYCDTELITAEGRLSRRVTAHWAPLRLWQGIGFLHPGVVARRAAYDRIGRFREDLLYAPDTDWIVRLHRAGGRFVKHQGICRMSLGGQSNREWPRARREYLTVLSEQRLPLWQRVLAWGWFAALIVRKRIFA